MGTTRRRGLADALFTKVQQRVLAVLFGNPSRSYYATEIIRLAQSGRGAVQRELARLQESGLVTVVQIGQQKHYQANPDSPLFDELRAMALKTFALSDVLVRALDPLATDIQAAFVYGSIARGTDTASSDVDVLIVSDSLSYADAFGALEKASQQLGRKVSPTIYSLPELHRLAGRDDNAFMKNLLAQPKLWLIGDERILTP
jgi:predicted nucleotidyltransferase